MRHIDLELRAGHIALDALLKATGLAASGGEAKATITAGRVQVDGRIELRRGCKVRAGQVVGVPDARVRVHAARQPQETAPADGEGIGGAAAGHSPGQDREPPAAP